MAYILRRFKTNLTQDYTEYIYYIKEKHNLKYSRDLNDDIYYRWFKNC